MFFKRPNNSYLKQQKSDFNSTRKLYSIFLVKQRIELLKKKKKK